MGCFMSFWPSKQPPAKLKAQVNRDYIISLADGKTCTGIFEGYIYKMANLGSPVHVLLMFESDGEHVALEEGFIKSLTEMPR